MKITEKSYEKLFNEKPVVRAIHAGLECGLFLEKYPYLDMISFGPTIKGAHTPEERIDIKTTEKFWNLLLDVLKNIPTE
jgi:dipeptidase D